MDETYSIKPKNVHIGKIGVSLLLFILEIVVSFIAIILFNGQSFYNTQLFETSLWLVGKLIPLFIAIILYRNDLKKSFIDTKRNFKKFIFYSLISFGVFYLFEIATSNYQKLMDTLFKIGETTNQASILTYFERDKSFINIFLLFITIVFIAPFIEEIEFRKLIFDAFDKKINFLIPTIISALLFGFVHLDFTSLTLKELAYYPVYVIPGLALALIYHFSGRNIYASFIVHAAINCISFVAIVTGL